MKGILVVDKSDLNKKPALFETLGAQSEKIEKSVEGIRFHSKNGNLMNMICALLDQEVPYKLEFQASPVSNGET